jgi:hypothetical protein
MSLSLQDEVQDDEKRDVCEEGVCEGQMKVTMREVKGACDHVIGVDDNERNCRS